MLHPKTELRFVSSEIGYGIFATEFIPQGTIMWVKDELDRIILKDDLAKLTPPNLENLLKYTYRNHEGNYIFCWDLTRYVNHSFEPNSMLTPLGFEIAITDIQIGDEITNDYGTLNIIEPFQCAKGPKDGREFVCPDDLSRFHQTWDKQVREAFQHISQVEQPLQRFLTPLQVDEISLITRGEATIPSVLNNLYTNLPR